MPNGSGLPGPGSVDLPVALQDLQASSSLEAPLPEVVFVEVLARSGLQVAYTHIAQTALIPPLILEANWLHMQTCLQQVGVAPLILIRDSSVAPLTLADEVIHSIEGIPAATVTMVATPVIQVGLSDFMATGDAHGDHLRSIMGRLLWTAAGLSVRDYPYRCAQQLVESE